MLSDSPVFQLRVAAKSVSLTSFPLLTGLIALLCIIMRDFSTASGLAGLLECSTYPGNLDNGKDRYFEISHT